MLVKLYLTRHGQTEWNLQRRLQGWKNSNLTSKGRKEAVLLGERLKSVDLDIIFSSSSMRAVETAEIIARDRDIEIKLEDNLREIHSGKWEGNSLSDIEKLFPEEYYIYQNAPHLYEANNGGETFFQVQKRAISVINRIIYEDKYENVLIITHGVTVRVVMAYFENYPMKKLWETPHINNTSLTLIEIDEKNINIPLYGDISHLKID